MAVFYSCLFLQVRLAKPVFLFMNSFYAVVIDNALNVYLFWLLNLYGLSLSVASVLPLRLRTVSCSIALFMKFCTRRKIQSVLFNSTLLHVHKTSRYATVFMMPSFLDQPNMSSRDGYNRYIWSFSSFTRTKILLSFQFLSRLQQDLLVFAIFLSQLSFWVRFF